MKTTKLFGFRYVVMGVVGASLLLAACSSGGGGTGQTQGAATPTPTSVPVTAGKTPTPTSVPVTAANTPTSVPATVARTPTPTPAPAGTGREIRVTLKENTFPKEIRVKAGEKVVFVITNEGKEKHEFEVPDLDVWGEIKPGQTLRLAWVVSNQKGKWDMGCFRTEEGFHEDMEGFLIIE